MEPRSTLPRCRMTWEFWRCRMMVEWFHDLTSLVCQSFKVGHVYRFVKSYSETGKKRDIPPPRNSERCKSGLTFTQVKHAWLSGIMDIERFFGWKKHGQQMHLLSSGCSGHHRHSPVLRGMDVEGCAGSYFFRFAAVWRHFRMTNSQKCRGQVWFPMRMWGKVGGNLSKFEGCAKVRK